MATTKGQKQSYVDSLDEKEDRHFRECIGKCNDMDKGKNEGRKQTEGKTKQRKEVYKKEEVY